MSGAVGLLVWIGALADSLGGFAPAGIAAGIVLMAYLAREWPRQPRFPRVMFAAIAAAALAAITVAPDPLATAMLGLRRGAGFAAFFLALSTLRIAAESSPLVRRSGAHLVAQPPGRRYAAVTGGGHLFGLILSYGAIDLLGAMAARATAEVPDPRIRAIRLRRMLMAAYRGFAATTAWSPLNIMAAVVATAVPAADLGALYPVGFAVAMAMLAVGWLEDRFSAARRAAVAGPRPETTETWAVHLGIVLMVLLVTAVAELVGLVFGVSLVFGITLATPLVAVAWLAWQSRRFGLVMATRLVGRRLVEFGQRLPASRGELSVLGLGGALGAALAAALPALGVAAAIAAAAPAAWVVALLVPVLILATCQIGLNPIVAVASIGAAFPDPAALGLPPQVLALACMCGWAVSANMTPLSASAMTTARWAGTGPWTVTAVWNGRYTLSVLVLSWAVLGMALALAG